MNMPSVTYYQGGGLQPGAWHLGAMGGSVPKPTRTARGLAAGAVASGPTGHPGGRRGSGAVMGMMGASAVRFQNGKIPNLFISMLATVGVVTNRFGDNGTGPLTGL